MGAKTYLGDLTIEDATNGVKFNKDLDITGAGGKIKIGSSDAITFSSGFVDVRQPIVMVSLTTTERDALTPVDGAIIYNVTDGRFQGYENGAWSNMI